MNMDISHNNNETILENGATKHMVGFFENRNNRIIALTTSIVIGLLFAFLLIENSIGVNYFLFCTTLIFIVGYVMHKDDNLDIKNFIFWVLTSIICFSVFLRLSSMTYTIFAILLFPLFLVAMTIFSGKKMPKNLIINTLIRFIGSIAFINKIFIAIKSLMKKDANHKKSTAKIL